MKKFSIISSDPERMGGTPVFRGTRVPIQAFFDIVPHEGIDGFLRGYPTVTKEMIEEFFQEMSLHFHMDKDWRNKKTKIFPSVKMIHTDS